MWPPGRRRSEERRKSGRRSVARGEKRQKVWPVVKWARVLKPSWSRRSVREARALRSAGE